MIETLISSKTRIKLLLKFFLNENNTSYLRGLEQEFGESSNSIRLELNRLERAGMLSSEQRGNRKYFRANTKHPLYNEIHRLVMKHVGLDRIVEEVVKRLGKVEEVYLSGRFSRGLNSEIIDLIFIGDIDKGYLIQLVDKVEKLVRRKIRYLIFEREEFKQSQLKEKEHLLLLWRRDD